MARIPLRQGFGYARKRRPRAHAKGVRFRAEAVLHCADLGGPRGENLALGSVSALANYGRENRRSEGRSSRVIPTIAHNRVSMSGKA